MQQVPQTVVEEGARAGVSQSRIPLPGHRRNADRHVVGTVLQLTGSHSLIFMAPDAPFSSPLRRFTSSAPA